MVNFENNFATLIIVVSTKAVLAANVDSHQDKCHLWDRGSSPQSLPYSIDLATQIQGASKKRSAKTREQLWNACTSKHAWTWRYNSKQLLSSTEMCNLLPKNITVLMIGDSLSAQLVWSWSSRLLVPENVGEIHFQGSVGVDRRQTSVPTCSHGSSVQQPGRFRVSNLILKESLFEFTASDLRCNKCLSELRTHPENFGLTVHTASEFEEMLEGFQVVVLNQHAHVNKFVTPLERCYYLYTANESGAWRYEMLCGSGPYQ